MLFPEYRPLPVIARSAATWQSVLLYRALGKRIPTAFGLGLTVIFGGWVEVLGFPVLLGYRPHSSSGPSGHH